MPWSFKATIAMFVVFAAGAVLIGFACFKSGWEALRYFSWGLFTVGVGLVGGLLFAIICAITQPAWRKQSLFAGAVALLLLAGLVLFARAA